MSKQPEAENLSTAEKRVNKKIALVTGASGGIGRATALKLAQRGFHVLVHYNSNEAKAAAACKAIEANGGSATLIRFDLSGASGPIEQVLAAALEGLAPCELSVLVNNAGIHKDTLTPLMSDEMFDSVQRTNLYGPFFLMRWASKIMMRLRRGCIVNVTSLAGQMGNPGQINYAASKAGLIAMTKTLAMEFGSRGLRVNAVAPGLIETEMIESIPQLDEMKKRIPLGRFGTVDEVASAIAFLCSDEASYITGHTLSINGGLFPS